MNIAWRVRRASASKRIADGPTGGTSHFNNQKSSIMPSRKDERCEPWDECHRSHEMSLRGKRTTAFTIILERLARLGH